MNWSKFSIAAIAATILSTAVFAQDAKDKSAKSKEKDKRTEEIVIRKKGGKTEKMTIVVDGDNVTINGKPVDEFRSDDVDVLRRERSLAFQAPRIRRMDRIHPAIPGGDFNFFRQSNDNKALLGVLTEKTDNGAKVSEVTKESAAEKAGLKKEDVIVKVDTNTIESPGDLIEAISKRNPKDKVEITYKRDGKENRTTAVLGENKGDFFNNDFHFNMPNLDFSYNGRPKIGLQIQDVAEGKGVQVKDVDDDSPAGKSGIKEGDVITSVNGQDIAGVDELRRTVRELKEGDAVKFGYKRDGKSYTAEVKIPKRLKTADL